ncbi:MAG: sugar-binding transcriptional regulator [Anaerolineae bacterium]|jgi:DNA-binding transcriptional regulator LsrR (DeoR family)|nr:sugar-binding transcriptional regulator [Anaerolineae bacterium]MBT3714585.1 sugar-binding transcriptional regulator [Anaerolineae bacterium]MBT4310869.1 sugar-binding transcriptional regulator [Anaerolineae bacterium]MBT4459550.1 sugar-binding transcriptional regulator [Anaerolineae bacterium]MBT4841872.1 sugar-binding transcriptional regulator [Anaerolineae bacterium]
MSTPQEDLMVQVAWMYYEDGLTHQAIAKKLNKSRVSITRLLKRARTEGIVQVRILKPLPYRLELKRQLQAKYKLEDALITESHSSFKKTMEEIGMAGVNHLFSILQPNIRLGFGWGSTVRRMAPYLYVPKTKIACKINDLAGNMLGQVNPYSISSKVAEVLSAPYEPLSMPVILQSKEARAAILSEPAVRKAYENAQKCDVAFVGLGFPDQETTLKQMGYYTSEQMDGIQKQGAVGDILMRYFDADGNPVSTFLDERVMALRWDEIKRIPYVVVLAAGEPMLPAIRGILRANICHCLITDTDTTRKLLES